MTKTQQNVVRAAVKQAERNAQATADMHARMINAFGEYSTQDRGTLMASAKLTDATRREARNLRTTALLAGVGIEPLETTVLT